MSNNLNESQIIACWEKNAAPWITAIKEKQIASRIQCTNQAILDTVLQLKPQNAIDIGCGEGWLTDTLQQNGINTLGIDAIPALIEYARQNRAGKFRQLTYEQLTPEHIDAKFDVAICNFSLIGQTSTEQVFKGVKQLLIPKGYFVVQTLHPAHSNGDQEYEDGWREGSWQGFSSQFSHPAPWYFRTVESWKNIFSLHGFQTPAIREAMDVHTNKPASIIFLAELKPKSLQTGGFL
jgi:2-polyprenyl-3-methyl-5-hydroxy-6-metoxy-1,4-benzoquinol methylase